MDVKSLILSIGLLVLLITLAYLQTENNISKTKYNALVHDLCAAELLDSTDCGAYIRMHLKDCNGNDTYYSTNFRGKEIYFRYNCNASDSGWTPVSVYVYKRVALNLSKT
jgi:hypothetical protein